MYNVHIEVASLVYIYVYVGSKTIFFPCDFIDIAYLRRYFRLIPAINSTGFHKKHYHTVVRVDGSVVRADQSRTMKLLS